MDLDEVQFVRPMLKKAERFKIQMRHDLQSLKKAMPKLVPSSDA